MRIIEGMKYLLIAILLASCTTPRNASHKHKFDLWDHCKCLNSGYYCSVPGCNAKYVDFYKKIIFPEHPAYWPGLKPALCSCGQYHSAFIAIDTMPGPIFHQ